MFYIDESWISTFLVTRAFGEEPVAGIRKTLAYIIRESSHSFVANAFGWALWRRVLDICIHWHNYVEQVCAHSGRPMLCALLSVCVPFVQHLVNMKQHYHLLSNLNVGRGWWERSNTFIYGGTRCCIIYFIICYVHAYLNDDGNNNNRTRGIKMRAENDFSDGRWK